MPIYEYQCESCSDEIEVIHAMSAAPPDTCSHCGGRLQRIPSRPSVNVGHFTSRSAERFSKDPVDRQAKQEGERLANHAKKVGIPVSDLFEVHDA